MNREECVFVMMTDVKGQEPSPPGEGARSAGEGGPTKCSVCYPHPAFGHPLPEGEGDRLLQVTVLRTTTAFSALFPIHSQRPRRGEPAHFLMEELKSADT